MRPDPYLSFRVIGDPVPKGSTKAFMAGGKPRTVDQSGAKGAAWAHTIRQAALTAFGRRMPGAEIRKPSPVAVELLFRVKKPKSVRIPKPPALSPAITTRPDLDKLVRAVMDALTYTVFDDDSQVVSIVAQKIYALDDPPGVDVVIYA